MDAWLADARDALAAAAGVPTERLDLSDDDVAVLLDLARIAAHESGERTNAPLLCYLVGRAQGDAEYERAFADVVEPAIRAFSPDLLLVSAGFDAHEADPLADIRVSDAAFTWMAERAATLAPRIGAVLEGGYNVETLPRLVEAALQGFRK